MIKTLPITVCFTHFKSLSLTNFEAALYSLKQQDMSQVESIVIVDNNSEDSLKDLLYCVESFKFEVPVNINSYKHGDPLKTHPWSTNLAVSKAHTPWIFFTRSDYLLHPQTIEVFVHRAKMLRGEEWVSWDGFITSYFRQLHVDIGTVNQTEWRTVYNVLCTLPNTQETYGVIDTGVWMARRSSFNEVGGLDETLPAWGHAQTEFQYRLSEHGVNFECIPNAMFCHPLHSAERDINLAHEQLERKGLNVKQLWERYEGPKVY